MRPEKLRDVGKLPESDPQEIPHDVDRISSCPLLSSPQAKARLADAKEAGIEADQVHLVPQWHPHPLCHNAAANLRREHGIEVARIVLGHRSSAITEAYAEVAVTTAMP